MITLAQLRRLQPKTKPYTVTDQDGLGIEVRPNGLKTWRLRYRLAGKQSRINLGRWPGISLAEAREKAAQIMGQVKAGIQPTSNSAHSRRRAFYFRDFAQKYLKDVASKVRKDLRPLARSLENDVYPLLGSMPLQSVTVSHVRSLVFAKRDRGHSQAAMQLRDLLKRIFDYAEACEAAPGNPARAVKRKFVARIVTRERALTEPEIGLFLRRLPAAPIDEAHKLALRLILLTLVRKSELRLARWEHIRLDRGEWEIPPELTKTNKGHIVYLSRQAAACFEALRRLNPSSPVVLPAENAQLTPIAASTLNHALNRVQDGMTHFTVHDLRRTAATRLCEMGYDENWVEKALNHIIKGVKGIYNRAKYAEQRRGMLQGWADALDSISQAAS